MTPELITVFGTIAFVVCFFTVIFVLLVIAGVFIFTRVIKVQKEAGRALAEDTHAFFARSAAELYPFTANAFEDISSQLQVNGQAALGNVHYRGRLQSLSQLGRGYVDFDLQLKFGKGTLQLLTTHHRLLLTFGGIGVSQVQAAADDRSFGVLIHEKKEVRLQDLMGRPAGCYHRSPLDVAGLAVEPAQFNFKSYFGPVEINERTVAELNRNPLIMRVPSDTEIAPFFRQVAADLSEDEEIWLLLLMAWEVYVKILVR